MGWSVFSEDPAEVGGILLKGDPTVPPTRWWNHLYLLWFRWKVVSIVEIKTANYKPPYSIGYVPFSGKAMIWGEEFRGRRFAVRHGHEDCRFFALDCYGLPVDLHVIERTTIDGMPDDVPLI